MAARFVLLRVMHSQDSLMRIGTLTAQLAVQKSSEAAITHHTAQQFAQVFGCCLVDEACMASPHCHLVNQALKCAVHFLQARQQDIRTHTHTDKANNSATTKWYGRS